MVIFGSILMVLSVVLFFVQFNARQKVASLRQARAGSISDLQLIAMKVASEIGSGSWRDYVKLQGDIQCDQPLTSELKQVPCVYYEMKVEREYEKTVTERDDEGHTTTKTERGSEVVSENSRSTPFTLKDSSGKIEVDPDDAQIDTVTVLDEFRQATSSTISFGGFSLSMGNNDGRTIGYRYQESILPLNRNVFIVGEVTDARGLSGSYDAIQLTIEKPTVWGKKYIISFQSEARLQKEAARTSKYSLYGMLAAFTAGAIVLGVGLTSA